MQQRNIKQKLSLIEQLEQLENNISSTLQKIKRIKNNIVIVGESGAGKSTLCNILMKKKIIFKYEHLQFKPIEDKSEIQFKISSNASQSQTDIPQIEALTEQFQICDMPGLYDSKSGLNDIVNCLHIQQIVNSSYAVQFVLVFAEKEFTENKFKYLIEILNQFQDNDMVMTFLITFVEEEQTKDYLCELLEKLLKQTETKLSEKAKQLLKRTLDLKEDRIHILSQPIECEVEDNYQFKQEEIEIIQQSILRVELFKNQNLKFHFTDINKQDIKPQLNNMQLELDISWKQLFQTSIEYRITIYQVESPDDEQYQLYIQNLKQKEQKDIKIYNQKLQQVNYLRQLILQQEYLNNSYITHANELKGILEHVEIVQSYSTLKIFCSFMSTSKLNKILQQYSQFDKVFIYSLIQFQVDESVEQPGISIYIKTNEFIIASSRKVKINLRGKDGEVIQPQKAGQEQKDGKNGLIGNDGQNGGTLIVDSLKYTNMSLLTIDVSGGNGSNGQDGGDGQDGQNGKDADPSPVDKQDQNYVLLDQQIIKEELKRLEKKQQLIDETHQRLMQMDQVSEQILKQIQELIEVQESNTLNKIRIVILENQGYSGDVGGNSGHGGVGGQGGAKGLIRLLNSGFYKHQQIENDGKNGEDGKDGQVGQGGIQGKNYIRAYLDVSYFKESMSKLCVTGSIATFEPLFVSYYLESMSKLYVLGQTTSGTLFVGLSLANLLFLLKDGYWITNGDFIDNFIQAADGQINVRSIEQREIRKNDKLEFYSDFQQFLIEQRQKKDSPIYRHLLERKSSNFQI